MPGILWGKLQRLVAGSPRCFAIRRIRSTPTFGCASSNGGPSCAIDSYDPEILGLFSSLVRTAVQQWMVTYAPRQDADIHNYPRSTVSSHPSQVLRHKKLHRKQQQKTASCTECDTTSCLVVHIWNTANARKSAAQAKEEIRQRVFLREQVRSSPEGSETPSCSAMAPAHYFSRTIIEHELKGLGKFSTPERVKQPPHHVVPAQRHETRARVENHMLYMGKISCTKPIKSMNVDQPQVCGLTSNTSDMVVPTSS